MLRIATASGDPDLETRVATDLAREPELEVVLRSVDRVELLAGLRAGMVDVVVVAGLPLWFDHEIAAEAAASAARVVALSTDPVQRHLFSSLGLEALPHDIDMGSLTEALYGPPAAPHGSPEAPTQGRLVAVWGPKGAPGRTTVAIELATLHARTQPATALVDADTYGGDVLQLLGIVDDVPSIVWAARSAAACELSPERLRYELPRAGAAGPVVLPGIPRSDLWPEVSELAWPRLLEACRAAYALTFVDTGFCLEDPAMPFAEPGDGRNHVSRRVLQEADGIVAVVRADPVNVKNLLWALSIHADHLDREKIHLVVNQVRRGDAREIGDLLGRRTGLRPAAFVPWEPSDLRASVEHGRAVAEIAPRSAVVKALIPVAERLGTRVPPRGLLARLGGRA